MARVACPVCGKSLKVPDDAEGKSARCPACGTGFKIRLAGDTTPAKGPVPTAAPSRAQPAAESPCEDVSDAASNPFLEAIAGDVPQSPTGGPRAAGAGGKAPDEVGFADDEIIDSMPADGAPPPPAIVAPPWAPGARVAAAPRAAVPLTPLRIAAILVCLVRQEQRRPDASRRPEKAQRLRALRHARERLAVVF